MRFLDNIYNPDLPEAKRYLVCKAHETPEQAWAKYKRWLEGKVIGEPKATKAYSVSELRQRNIVGVYADD